MTIFRKVSGPLTLFAGDPRTIYFPITDADGAPQLLTGRTFRFVIRRDALVTAAIVDRPTILALDGMSAVATLTGAQTLALATDHADYALAYDLIEMVGDDGVTRWSGRIALAPGSGAGSDDEPAWLDLDGAAVVAAADVREISERGAVNPIEQRLKDLGETEEATPEAMVAWMQGQGAAGAAPLVEEATERAAEAVEAATGAAADAIRSESAADRAELARDAAAAEGPLYVDVPTGLAATSEGATFKVAAVDGRAWAIFRKVSGAAVYVDGVTSDSLVRPIVDTIDAESPRPGGFYDPFGFAGLAFHRGDPIAAGYWIGAHRLAQEGDDISLGDHVRVRARGVASGDDLFEGGGNGSFGIEDRFGFGAGLSARCGPRGTSMGVTGGFAIDTLFLERITGDGIDLRDRFGFGGPVSAGAAEAAAGSTDYAARDAANVAYSMALASRPIAVVQKPKRGSPGKIVVNIGATNGQSHSRSARGYPCLTLAWALYADEYVFSWGEASRPAGSVTTVYDPLTAAQPFPLRAVAHINSAKQSNAQLQAQGPDQAIPGEGYEISGTYWLRAECLNKWSAQEGRPVSEDPYTHFFALACGVGGQPLSALLRPDSDVENSYFNRLRSGLIQLRDWYVGLYGADNVEFVVTHVDIAHGQETYSELPGGAHNTEPLYRTGLQQYRGQIIETIEEVFGNGQLPPAFFVGQASGEYTKDGSDLHVGTAQLKLCTDVPGWFWGQPDYVYFNLPTGHPDSNGYRQQGQYRGDAWSRVLIEDRAPARVNMRSATWDRVTGEIVIDFVSTEGPLEYGEPREGFVKKAMADMGLCAKDSGGLIALDNVRFVGAMTVAATPVRAPAEAPVILAGSKTFANGHVGIRCRASMTAREVYELVANAGQHPDANQPDLVGQPYNMDIWCAAGAVQAEEI